MKVAGFPLIRGHQVLLETDILRHLKRTIGTPAEDLICYYVPSTRKFCIGVWRNRTGGYVSELLSFSKDAKFTRADVGFVRYFLSDRRRKDNEATRRRVAERRRKRLRDRMDARKEERAAQESARRKLPIHLRDHPFLNWYNIQ